MKKFTLALVAVISAILMCFGMAACSSPVAGNTYVFDDVKVTVADGSADGMQEAINQAIESIKEGYSSAEIKFDNDNTCTMTIGTNSTTSYYSQDGATVYMYENKEDAVANNKDKAEDGTLKVSGSKIEMTMEEGGMKATITFKKK